MATGVVRRVRRAAIALATGVVGYQHFAHTAQTPGRGATEVLHAGGDIILAVPLAAAAVLGAVMGARRIGRPGVAWVAAAAGFAALLIPASLLHAVIEQSGGHAHASATALLRHGFAEAPASLIVALAVARGAMAWRQRRAGLRGFAPGWAVALALLATPAVLIQARPHPASAGHVAFAQPLPIPPVLTGSEITIRMAETQVPILSGATTTMWTYNGTFPGPTIRRPSGQTTRVTFVNDLPASAGDTTIHHHGNHSASSEDGQPHTHLITPGGRRTYTYDFVEDGKPERAAFQWYHDHVMDHTARNVTMGLAGMVILDDDVDAALDLPAGEFDVPIMFADRNFDDANQIEFVDDATGRRGEYLLANGRRQPHFEVADRRYRLRLLNASNVTDVEFALSDGTALTQIATESGLLPAPVTRSSIRLSPAERTEVVVDFSAYEVGSAVVLRNLLGFGETREVIEFRVARDVADDSIVPSELRPLANVPITVKGTARLWLLTQSAAGDLEWSINFRGFDPGRIDTAPLNPRRDLAEQWIFVNTTSVDHVMHIHDVDWRLLLRASPDPYPAAAQAVEEAGLKESFRVRPNEVVVVASRFTDHLGTYVFHCHVLEHEDHRMMAQFQVVA